MATREQELKIELYDVIERQALLAQENQRLENIKVEKVKSLNEVRQAAATAGGPKTSVTEAE